MRWLLDYEWKPTAERLAVGSSVRLVHSCGRTPSLSIRRTSTGASAYCFRCHNKGYFTNKYRPPKGLREEPMHTYNIPTEYVPVSTLPDDITEYIASWMLTKGLDLNKVLRSAPIVYSTKHNRIGFNSVTGGLIARHLDNAAVPKWVQYGARSTYWGGWLPYTETLYITEDILSAVKINYTTGGGSVVAALGVRLNAELKVALLKNPPFNVVMCFDGDAAGRKGALSFAKELTFLGINCIIAEIPEGKDPKDLQQHELYKLITGGG